MHGASRGGLTTGIHALVDADGFPIVLKFTEGQAQDGRSAADMFYTIGPGHSFSAGDACWKADGPRSRPTKTWLVRAGSVTWKSGRKEPRPLLAG